MTTKTEIIAEAFKTLRAGMISEAKAIISEHYPFKPLEKEGRTYREHQKIKIFYRESNVSAIIRVGWLANFAMLISAVILG